MNLNMEPLNKKRGKLFYISTSASDDQQASSVEKEISEDDDSSWSEYSDSGDDSSSQPLSFEKLPKRSMSAAGGFTYFLSNKSIYPSEDKLSLLSTMFNSQQNLANNNTNNNNSNRRLPPPPNANELDSDDDSDDGGIEFNARNSKRLEQLALKHNNSRSNSNPDISAKGAPRAIMSKSSPAQSSKDISYASTLVGSDDDAPVGARPQSPRTIRRNMLASELSESLRKSILWERETRARMLLGGHNNSSGMLNAKLQEKFARQEAEERLKEEDERLAEAEELESATHLARIKNSVSSINTSHRRYRSTPERSDNQYPTKMLSTTTIQNQPSSPSIAGRNLTENDLSKYRRTRRSTNPYLSSSPDYHG